MKKSILFFLLLWMMGGYCLAQEEEVFFPTDRPGYTWGADVLPLGKVSWENGVCFERDPEQRTVTAPSTIVRYGLFENVELRVGADGQFSQETAALTKLSGMTPLTIGTKIKCYESDNWLPSVGLLAQLQSARIGSKELLPSQPAPALYLLFENLVTDRFYVCYNAGMEWDGETATPTTFLSLCLGFDFTDQLGSYVETYNYLHPEGNQYLSEIGLYYFPIPRLQLDLEVDLDVEHLKDYFSVGFGVAWMIN